jgi:hypothetical protein
MHIWVFGEGIRQGKRRKALKEIERKSLPAR